VNSEWTAKLTASDRDSSQVCQSTGPGPHSHIAHISTPKYKGVALDYSDILYSFFSVDTFQLTIIACM
jgi:hypothetical protein